MNIKIIYVFDCNNNLIDATNYNEASNEYGIPKSKLYFRVNYGLPLKYGKSMFFFSTRRDFKIPQKRIAANIDLKLMNEVEASQSLSNTFGSVWRRIKGYDGRYWVSRDGRIVGRRGRLLQYIIQHRGDGSNDTVGVGLIISAGSKVGSNDKQRVLKVSRLVGLAFIPNPNKYHWLLCKDGNYKNLDASNWFWSKGSPHPNTYKSPVKTLKCPECHKVFKTKFYRKKENRRKFCSAKCGHASRKGIKFPAAFGRDISKRKKKPLLLINRKDKTKTLNFGSLIKAAKHLKISTSYLSNMINGRFVNRTGYNFKFIVKG